jgi:hypothetical protein
MGRDGALCVRIHGVGSASLSGYLVIWLSGYLVIGLSRGDLGMQFKILGSLEAMMAGYALRPRRS